MLKYGLKGKHVVRCIDGRSEGAIRGSLSKLWPTHEITMEASLPKNQDLGLVELRFGVSLYIYPGWVSERMILVMGFISTAIRRII